MYENGDAVYARQRLAHTIISHQGKAVMVIDVMSKGEKKPLNIFSQEILSGQPINDSIDNYDLTPVKLGLINQETGRGGYPLEVPTVSYLVRKPMRSDWRQGLRKENTVSELGDFWWDAKSLSKTIEGLFPTIEEARERFKKRAGNIAWCRDFFLNERGEIHYRAFGKVGNFIDNTRQYLLDGKFFWVEEHLREALQ